jgi:hypothetical protein
VQATLRAPTRLWTGHSTRVGRNAYVVFIIFYDGVPGACAPRPLGSFHARVAADMHWHFYHTSSGSPPSSSRTRRLALRGGYSSAWNSALVHASANGARNDLSLEETCSALKLHGLAVSVSQVQDLLVMSGAAGKVIRRSHQGRLIYFTGLI